MDHNTSHQLPLGLGRKNSNTLSRRENSKTLVIMGVFSFYPGNIFVDE